MNYYELKKQATPGPLVIDPKPSYTPDGKHGVTKCFLSSPKQRAAGVAGILALADISLDEADANAALLAHWFNHGPMLLEAVRAISEQGIKNHAACIEVAKLALDAASEVEGI